METLEQIWSAYKGEKNQVGKFEHIAKMIGYKDAEINAFLDAPAHEEEEED
jgi:hypothetical protein